MLQLNNGENDGWPCKVFIDYGAFLPTTSIAAEWKQRSAISQSSGLEDLDVEDLIAQNIMVVEGPVRPVMFDDAWIPFMDSNGDVFWAVDFNPAAGGNPGQIIEVDWESVSYKVIAPSFEAFLKAYLEQLKSRGS